MMHLRIMLYVYWTPPIRHYCKMLEYRNRCCLVFY